MRHWIMNIDGDEQPVNEINLRNLAKNNAILDVDTLSPDDLIDIIENCFPDVSFVEV